ncbi:M55 family metallopeptidase [Phenylobacterium sp.]|uniref:M55 family metallopeptidase n=1 Tax=Phenylobacterium sp. TaxID=1871053 RepID=UPI0035B33FF2
MFPELSTVRRLLISADIEGCAGVASQHALAPDRWEWAAARQWMTGEVVAAAEAALNAGYDEVLVSDGHGNAHNILPDALPARVRLIRSWPRPLLQMQGVEAEGVEQCFFVGYHNGSMGEGGVLAHSYHGGAFRDLRLNGVSCSEGYLNAALAGEFGVPVSLVCGDAETAADAQRYSPMAKTCVVKSAIGWRAVAGLTPAESREAIGAAAREALGAPAPAPFRLEGPYEFELEMTSRVAAEMLSWLPGVEPAGPYVARAVLPSLADVMRLTAAAMLYSPTGAIPL